MPPSKIRVSWKRGRAPLPNTPLAVTINTETTNTLSMTDHITRSKFIMVSAWQTATRWRHSLQLFCIRLQSQQLNGQSDMAAKGEIVRCSAVHFGRREGRRGSAMLPFDRAMVVSYKLSIDHCAISKYHSAAICRQMSPTLKSTGWVTLGQNWGRGRPI